MAIGNEDESKLNLHAHELNYFIEAENSFVQRHFDMADEINNDDTK